MIAGVLLITACTCAHTNAIEAFSQAGSGCSPGGELRPSTPTALGEPSPAPFLSPQPLNWQTCEGIAVKRVLGGIASVAHHEPFVDSQAGVVEGITDLAPCVPAMMTALDGAVAVPAHISPAFQPALLCTLGRTGRAVSHPGERAPPWRANRRQRIGPGFATAYRPPANLRRR